MPTPVTNAAPSGQRSAALDSIWEEVTYLAYHLHWPLDDLLDLEHADRVRLLESVGGLNERAWSAVRDQTGVGSV